MRILKFAGVFLGTFLIIFLIVFGFNLNALFTLFENSGDIREGREWVEKTYSLKGLTEYIGEQPQRVSIASLALANPDSSILYNEHTPRTMGRLSSLFLAIEYMRQVERGVIDPEEQIPLKVINFFQLPYMDVSGHEKAVEVLGNRNKVSPSETVRLADLVQSAVEFNDLAAFDYLYLKVGDENIRNLLETLELETTELPLPFSGLYITLKPELYKRSFEMHMDILSGMSRPEFNRMVIKQSQKLLSNDLFRKRMGESFEEDEGLGIHFSQQRDALALFPKTTALEMAELMSRLQKESLISKDISRKLKGLMDWPLNSERLNNDFHRYGAIYDSRMGFANGIDFGRSAYSKEPFAQAVFFDDLQVAFWFHMSSNHMHQDFEQRLIWDPALRAATVQQIETNSNPTTHR